MGLSLFYNIFSVFLIMLPGYFLIRKQFIPESVLKELSKIVIWLIYPCLILDSITQNFTLPKLIQSWQLPVAVFIITMLGFFVGLIIIKWIHFKDSKQKRAFLYQLTFNNYSFLPLAIIAKLFAPKYVAALVFSTLGAEIAVWTIGVAILNHRGRVNLKENLGHLLSPPLIGIYLSVLILALFHVLGVTYQEVRDKITLVNYTFESIATLGMATVPLSMIIAGARIAKTDAKELGNLKVWFVVIFRLLVIPAIAIFAMNHLFANNKWLVIMSIVSIMPVSINSLVLGELYDADQGLLGSTVLLTHVLSLMSIPLWLSFIL